MNVVPMIARIKDMLVPDALGSVGECDNIEDALEKLKGNRPCAFVMFSGETANGEQPLTGLVKQHVFYRFLVAIGVQGAGVGGKAKGTDMEEVRDQVKDALVGFKPEGAATPILYARAVPLIKNLAEGVLFIGIEFATSYYLRKEENYG